MSKRDAIRLKARIERETGDGPADVMLDTSGRHSSWMVTYAGRRYYSASEWEGANRE